MSTLYINEHGTVLSIKDGQFIATYKDGKVHILPQEMVESITVFGNSSITTPCMNFCLEEGKAVNFFTGKGKFFGKLTSTRHSNATRIKNQVYAFDDETFCLQLAKNIVKAKVNNQKIILRRYERNNETKVNDIINSIKCIEKQIEQCTNVEELMGNEGISARYYFSGLSALVNNDFRFNGRSKQPPKDAFNSMLSLGYTILLYEIYAEIENRGLNPYIGFYHKNKANHPALASDLIEEWRCIVVDSTVMSLVQGNEISIEEFTTDENTGAVYLSSKAMRIFIKKLNAKLLSTNRYITDDYNTIRRCLYHQSVNLTKAIENRDITLYKPLIMR